MKAMRIVSRVFIAAGLIVSATSCGNVVRDGRSPMMLVIQSIQGIRGAATAGTPAVPLISDVITLLTTGGVCTTAVPCPTFYNDMGTATLSLAQKDISVAPTSNNQVTITKVHVDFTRTDMQNPVQGVDVPFSFDSGVTITVPPTGTATATFDVVRNSAKLEEPLLALRNNNIILTMIANITFYGTDQVGNAITATGTLQVNFGNFADQ